MVESRNNTNLSDEDLMHHFTRTMDESAIETIVSRYRGAALKYAFNILKNWTLAEDAVQETFIRIVATHDRYNSHRRFAAWFYTILRHICIDMVRRETKGREKLDFVTTEKLGEIAEDTRHDKTSEILESLDVADCEILTLKFIHGMSLEEIAKHLSISVDAAKKRSQRALIRLRKKINLK